MDDKEKVDTAQGIAWADKFIEKYRDELERMHGYTSEMERADELAERLRQLRSKRQKQN